MNLSLIIPLFNEEESIKELYELIKKEINTTNLSYEIIFIDDGSTDNSWEVIESLKKIDPNIKSIQFRINHGKSSALDVGFKRANGDVIITMDADLQDNPREIRKIYDMIINENYDIVSGWKKKRYDPLSKTIPTKIFNWATRKISGLNLHDFNCGLKGYKKEVIKSLKIHGEMHRYIPVLAKFAGFKKIGELVVEHKARKYGKTKFGIERFINGFLDLMTIIVLKKFGRRPMHFFGFIGTLMFFIGTFASIYIGLSKIIRIYKNESATLVTNSPWFYIALSCMIIGVILFSTGFISEMILKLSRNEKEIYISKE